MRSRILAQQLGETLLSRGLMMTTAESCTGGGIAYAITDVAGSSAWFDRGFVTYSNAAKSEMLGVAPALIEQHGAVSEAVVEAMAKGACAASGVALGVAVSGVAGPDGGTPEKPVGTVWLACYLAPADRLSCRRLQLDGDRIAVRQQTIAAALADCLALLAAPRT
ncbi:CinA family protein [Zobellella sp. DQSA1]|uniref:CinA family protein n=1 Tax=Zobellella sp. DQSA1 TaxID=3342386 RepID=UPI0035C01FF0